MYNEQDAFDGEPSPGGGYERSVPVPLFNADGIPRRIVMRFRGQPLTRVSVVLEERRAGVHGSLIRYDDAHGQFHRHAPGWPEPPSDKIEAWFDLLPQERAPYAHDEIFLCYPEWEAKVFEEEHFK